MVKAPRARLAADAAAAVRSHLRLDGRHVPGRQDARLQQQDARADAELRRLRRRCHPLRLGDGAGDLVAAVARVAPDRRLPDGAQGDRARVEAVAHRPLRRRGAEARRLQDGDVLLERLHLVEVGVRSRLGHRPQLHPRVAPQQRRLPLEDGQGLDHAAAHQAAVRLPRHHRAARRLHAEERVPGQVLEQALHRPAEAGADRRAARPHQGREAQDQRQRQGVPGGAARRRDHRQRRALRRLHRRPQEDGDLRHVRGGGRLGPRRPVLRARQRRPRRHRVPGADARPDDHPRAGPLAQGRRSSTPTSR